MERQFAQYRILKELGVGATAQVFAAEDTKSGQTVALKIFKPEFSKQIEFQKRIAREVKAISRLNHPNIVRIIDFISATEEKSPAAVLEYVDGIPLTEYQSKLPYILPELSCAISCQILDALEHAHSLGVIHRDLKPSNIIISKNGTAFVTDFGLAKVTDASVTGATLTGTILGSPDYMAPEQAEGDIVTARTDVFAIAAVLYFLVTGTRPFARSSSLATLAAVIKGDFEPVQNRNPKISPSLAAIIQLGLAKNPSERFSSAQNFKEAVENYLYSIGLDKENFSLSQWQENPSQETMKALAQMAETLATRAEKKIASKAYEKATETISHLSLIAPESQALENLLEKLTSRRKKTLLARPLSYIVATSFLIAMTALLLQLRKDPVTVTEPVKPIAETKQEDSIVQPMAAVTKAEIPEVPEIPKTLPKEVKKAPVQVGTVRFDVRKDVTVLWNGKKVSNRGSFTQKVGQYSLILRKPGFKDIRQTVKVVISEPTVIRVQ